MGQELIARGHQVSENTVAKLMRDHGMRAASSRKFRVTTDSNHSRPVAENVLNREFSQELPDRVWLADITYIWTREGWLYLACVLDTYSRRIVGWEYQESMTDALVLASLRKAIKNRQPPAKLIHHSDRGGQYASGDYRTVLRRAGMLQSMSAAADCYDNAFMESCFGTLKTELELSEYADSTEAVRKLSEYVRYYNRDRRHSSLGYLNPAEFEEQSTVPI